MTDPIASPSDEPTVEETLAWESEHRRTASAGAIVAGVVILIGLVIQAAVQTGAPQVTLLRALQHASTIPHLDLRVDQFIYISNHGGTLLIGYILQGGGYIAAILGIGFLFRATSARRIELRRWVLPMVLTGLVMLAIAAAITGSALVVKAHSFAHGADHSHHAANQVVVDNKFVRYSSFLQFFGAVLFAFGMVMLSLNAMRCGLLTRFLGVLGVIAGILYVFNLGTPLYPVPFVFWTIMVGVLIGGHWFTGVPPAWASGVSEPWPSSAEIRAQRESDRAAAGGGGPRLGRRPAPRDEPAAETVPAGDSTPAPHPSSKKRKRKRR